LTKGGTKLSESLAHLESDLSQPARHAKLCHRYHIPIVKSHLIPRFPILIAFSSTSNHLCTNHTMAATSDLRVEKLFSVKDYVCVVTGGGSGIGLMASQALAANGARWHFVRTWKD